MGQSAIFVTCRRSAIVWRRSKRRIL